MIRALAALPALALAACAPAPGYRDDSVPMASMAIFDPVQYSGLWYEVARFPTPGQAGCAGARSDYSLTSPGRFDVRNLCVRDGAEDATPGTAEVVGPGRLRVRLSGVPASEHWVLWVDADYRTAVVGTPSGNAGWILNRDPEIPADRLAAARRVLAFNGYDTGRLAMTGQGGA